MASIEPGTAHRGERVDVRNAISIVDCTFQNCRIRGFPGDNVRHCVFVGCTFTRDAGEPSHVGGHRTTCMDCRFVIKGKPQAVRWGGYSSGGVG